jgi:hypothetical protein
MASVTKAASANIKDKQEARAADDGRSIQPCERGRCPREMAAEVQRPGTMPFRPPLSAHALRLPFVIELRELGFHLGK